MVGKLQTFFITRMLGKTSKTQKMCKSEKTEKYDEFNAEGVLP